MFIITLVIKETYVDPYYRPYVHQYYRSGLERSVASNFSHKSEVNPYTGAVGRNRYIHDGTSAYLWGPDSYGRVGHAGAPDVRHEMRLPDLAQSYNFPNSVSFCAAPHFTMTEHDGCQPVR
jgi:hypothetical protein